MDPLLQLIRSTMSDLKKSPATAKPKQVKKQPNRTVHGGSGQPRINGSVSTSAVVGYELQPRVVKQKTGAEGQFVQKVILGRVESHINMGARAFPTRKSTHKKLCRADRVFKTAGVGSSRSVVLGIIK